MQTPQQTPGKPRVRQVEVDLDPPAPAPLPVAAAGPGPVLEAPTAENTWWEATKAAAQAAPVDVSFDSPKTVQPDVPRDSQGRVAMYWFDAAEEGNRLFLFGKMEVQGRMVSCCVIVNGQMRSLFALPRIYAVDGTVRRFITVSCCLTTARVIRARHTERFACANGGCAARVSRAGPFRLHSRDRVHVQARRSQGASA